MCGDSSSGCLLMLVIRKLVSPSSIPSSTEKNKNNDSIMEFFSIIKIKFASME